MNNVIRKLKSDTAKAICKWYFTKNGEGSVNIFESPESVENAIDLAIRRGATTPAQIRKEVINFLIF